MRVHVTVSEMKARHDNGNDDAHIIWLRSTYCAYYYPLSTHSSYGLFPASCYNDAHPFLIEDAFTATARSNYVKRSPRGVSPPSARVCVRWASSSRASGPPTQPVTVKRSAHRHTFNNTSFHTYTQPLPSASSLSPSSSLLLPLPPSLALSVSPSPSPPRQCAAVESAGNEKTIFGDRSPTWPSPWHSRRWPHGPLTRAAVAATAVHTRARAQAPVHTLPSRSIPRAHSRTTHIPLACMGPDCMFPLYHC